MLLLLKDATIIGKWGHNDLPTDDDLKLPIEQSTIGKAPTESVQRKLATVLAWFFIPLLALTLADRTWQWGKFVRRKLQKAGIKDKIDEPQEI